jgi:anti-anti-sigma factor
MLVRQKDSRLHLEETKDAILVGFTTRTILGEGPCQETGKQLFDHVDKVGRCNLVLDFTGVERLDSAFLAKLITLHKKIKAAGGQLALCHLSPVLSEIFKTLQLHRLLPIHSRKQDALQALQRP